MPTKTLTRRTPAKAKHGRAPGQTQVSISLSKELMEAVDRCADADCRTRSNWITIKLAAAVAKELK